MEKTRITAYVEADTADLLKSTAEALGQSQSSLAAEVITYASPVLEVMRNLALDLASAPDRHRDTLAAFADRLTGIVTSRETEFEALKMSLSGDLGLPDEPPPSNTGVAIRNV